LQKSPQNRCKIAAKLSYEMHLLYQEDSNLIVCKNIVSILTAQKLPSITDGSIEGCSRIDHFTSRS
jgi:hypothetical protein